MEKIKFKKAAKSQYEVWMGDERMGVITCIRDWSGNWHIHGYKGVGNSFDTRLAAAEKLISLRLSNSPLLNF